MRKWTTKEFIQMAQEQNPNAHLFDYSETEYIDSKTPVKIFCTMHQIYFSPLPKYHLKGGGCKKCRDKQFSLGKEEFIIRAKRIHSGLYDYSKVSYINAKTNVEIFCSRHKKWFLQTPETHLAGSGCSDCAKEKMAKSHAYTREEFVLLANQEHNFKWSYDKVFYKDAHTKVIIVCNIHGEFSQTPNDHLSGKGCPDCGKENGGKKHRTTLIEFKETANQIHDFKYLYDKVVYINAITSVIITCPCHGDFEQMPNVHLRGSGCSKCNKPGGLNKLTCEEFIARAINVHGKNRYDYRAVNYLGYDIEVKLICLVHGEFNQTPHNHLCGHGCGKCSHNISKPEIAWLNLLELPDDKEHRQVRILGKLVDGFDPDTNTVYELHGDFWHGHPAIFDSNAINPRTKTTYGELYSKTIQRERLIRNAGYTLITIWEHEFKQFVKDNK